MAISDEDVLHVARLACLRLEPDEVGRMREQLATILGHVQELSALDLEGVEPTAHALDLVNSVRADAARPSWPRADVLRGAPAPADGGFRVPPTA
ncbi:MAG TPA: Asp-tRNA(Asn)/Glu-tRNA(Gln) amidotransferase subunit GatC [Gaiellales bacterium]|jgi:aspartyl-tRNA(Asn)/glutamyl-tRNA(Gln) amidotransferase subunit C|nr:Asp-tRNA(Asn)/Glu-tRNA(Gln) amidotransferase subunit GatC [Gaiellales bacterium]